jgi:hypothetical protein
MTPTFHVSNRWRRQRRAAAAAASAACAAAAAALLLVAPGPAAAQSVHNVSQIVLGVAEPTPAGIYATWPCGVACRWASASGAQMGNGWTTNVGPSITAAWPVMFSVGMPDYGSVDDDLYVAPPAAGVVRDTLAAGAKQRAQVVFAAPSNLPSTSRQLDVQTWKSGSGAVFASYAVRIDTPAGAARKTYLRFGVPALQRAVKQAVQFGGPSGNQPIAERPARLQARTAFDVYVDGLPVWSSASMQLMPKRFQPDVATTLALDTGAPMAAGQQTLFLGSLPGGSSRTAVIVMRSELRVDAGTCHTDNGVLGTDIQHCDTRLEGLRLPTKSVAPLYLHEPDIAVYTH